MSAGGLARPRIITHILPVSSRAILRLQKFCDDPQVVDEKLHFPVTGLLVGCSQN
jgi:hypothetical protein